ncbi:hypothetical protein RHSIM_Rhsim01G0095600 [Rhododendron simsii]|uniref:ABC-type xenobiotic transporter n=1 Tax=Rhododendron simsii TaxID=118357 RepID=A0A834M0Q3_RHOSS|nr:hypothetical protein RHSIM_Rhsim01G0095600 [Rhododendron simsii]
MATLVEDHWAGLGRTGFGSTRQDNLDRRLKAMVEALTNMKVLKLYAWETHLKNAVEKNRYAKKTRDAEGLNQAISISTTRISWDSSSLKPTLNDINLEVHGVEKIAVCGEVGSGKSTLIAAILGEVPDINGIVQVYREIAYVSQTGWIQMGTIQENILFGCTMDQNRYGEVLEKCSLKKDLEKLLFGDCTIIGELGVNLSGGQKQRVQLARALYNDADIYLLDDPFSAVDAYAATSLFNEYVMGALARKMVLLVTHQVDFLPALDSILVRILTVFTFCVTFFNIDLIYELIPYVLVSEGKIVEAASYDQLLASSKQFQNLVNAHKVTSDSNLQYSTTKSSVASHLAESSAGALTIRAFGEEDRFFTENLQLTDANASSFFHKFSANEWLFQCLEILCAIVLSCLAVGITFLSNDASKSEPTEESIIVDGINISTLGLHDLRSHLEVIPQDPTLFSGSVRYNLDPLMENTDQEIWAVLKKCQLREAVQEKDEALDVLEVEDDEVENTSEDRDASSNKEENLVDDTERQRKMYSDDKVEEDEKFEEDERVEKSDNGSYQSVLGKEPNVEKSPLQEETVGDRAQGNNGSDGRFNEESSNSVQGLDSIVTDSQSPLKEECFESIKNSCQTQNIEAHGGDEIDGYIIASQEQEQISVDKKLQNTIIAVVTFDPKLRDELQFAVMDMVCPVLAVLNISFSMEEVLAANDSDMLLLKFC